MIIGIIGKKQSGKDTVANYITKKYGFIRIGLADPMKEAVKHIFLMSDDQLWGDSKEVIDERYGVTPREILQVIGTELFQYDIYNHLPNLMEKVPPRTIWINRFVLMFEETKKKLNISSTEKLNKGTVEPKEPDIVISDVRFKHEASRIHKMGGKLIRIERPSLTSSDKHPSEVEMDKIHGYFIILNDGSLEDLYRKVDKYIQKVVESDCNCGKNTDVKE